MSTLNMIFSVTYFWIYMFLYLFTINVIFQSKDVNVLYCPNNHFDHS